MLKKKGNKKQFSIVMLIIGIVLLLHTISFMIPLIWSFFVSLKGKLEFRTNMFGLPKEWLFSNYSMVLRAFFIKVDSGGTTRSVYVMEMLGNSIFYAVGCAFVQTTVQYVMAYLASRYKTKFSSVVYAIVLFAMAFPIVGSNASGLAIAEKLGLKDSILGMYLMKAYFLGMYFLVFFAQLKVFPKDFDEAAELDGASQFAIMWRIIFPMVKTTFFTIALLLFIGYWNDYQTPMLYMPNKPTLAYGLYYFADLCRISVVSTTPMKLAACMMMMIPILILFLFFHKKLLGNISMGGLKE